jgi:hypothetical protein
MRPISQRIYDFQERRWSATEGDFSPPAIRPVNYGDSTETFRDPPLYPELVHRRDTTPSSCVSTFGTAAGEVRGTSPPHSSDAVNWASQVEQPSSLAEEISSPARALRRSSAPSFVEPLIQVTQRSSIVGTTTWASQSINYRISTVSLQASLSGATASGPYVEVIEEDECEDPVRSS